MAKGVELYWERNNWEDEELIKAKVFYSNWVRVGQGRRTGGTAVRKSRGIIGEGNCGKE